MKWAVLGMVVLAGCSETLPYPAPPPEVASCDARAQIEIVPDATHQFPIPPPSDASCNYHKNSVAQCTLMFSQTSF